MIHRLHGLHRGAFPPRWAEALLCSCLSPSDRLSVSGDLLEEYRSRVHAGTARSAVNVWYIRQVLGFAWRAHIVWALLLSAAFASRIGLDWFVPTTDFKLRASILTAATATIFLTAGFAAAWRSRSAASGGLLEAFTLPLMLVAPGAVLGVAGGVLGRLGRVSSSV